MSRHLSGLRAWTWQRLSAIYMAVYVGYFMLSMLALPDPLTHEVWRAWLSDTFVMITTSLFYLALLIHVWVGMRDVLIDYVHPPAIRAAMLGGLALFLAACAVWIVKIMATIA